ncbi:DUF4302 domain-containing protein [Sphingobacterium composti Ten et al. 2007 non Yoo et al. 2007]|uniref:DUF4302 domain-containing protein n=1 Tax=Sphingobacterium composti TaxID=363260 RepID=UPI00135876F2|nr:DUF4302 domain-containing protein [Sphingobacterium composti Ten et al. 2007 non Yoo et al. 2007]
MRKILIMLITAAIVVGCSKQETELIFNSTPEERMNQSLAELKSTLVNAPNGWIVGMETGTKGGYGFYMDFSEDDNVTMYSDVNEGSRSVSKNSTYRIKWGTTASLIFDSYSYISLLQDPQPSVAGGVAGKGFQSDLEFNLNRISGDSMIFSGKKYNNQLILVKASEYEKSGYLNEKFPEDIKIINEYLNNGIPVVKVGDVETEISINSDKKVFSLVGLIDNEVVGVDIKYFNIIGESIGFIKPIAYNNEYFTAIVKEESGYKLLTQSGMKFDIYKSDNYILPPAYKLGSAISKMTVPGAFDNSENLPAKTWSSSFAVDWINYNVLAKTSGYNLVTGTTTHTFVPVRNEISVTTTIFQNTSPFTATYAYKYSLDNDRGIIKFTSISAVNGNGGIIVPYMEDSFFANMKDKEFNLSYIKDEKFGNAIQFTRVDDPNYFFTWFY